MNEQQGATQRDDEGGYDPPEESSISPTPAAESGSAPSLESMTALWRGEVIAGKYRVDKVVGRGGMGVVLAAHHLTLDETVAIKVLRATMMGVPGMVARFIREARASSKIKSENVVRVTDVDTLLSGVPYMIMEYLEGTDLLAELRRRPGGMPIDETVGYILEACTGIAEAHAVGIVHRDLKPGTCSSPVAATAGSWSRSSISASRRSRPPTTTTPPGRASSWAHRNTCRPSRCSRRTTWMRAPTSGRWAPFSTSSSPADSRSWPRPRRRSARWSSMRAPRLPPRSGRISRESSRPSCCAASRRSRPPGPA